MNEQSITAKLVTKYILEITPKQHCSSCWNDLDGVEIVENSLEELFDKAIEVLTRNHIWGFPLSRYTIWESEYIEFEDISLPTGRNANEWTEGSTSEWLTILFSDSKFQEEMIKIKDKEEQTKLKEQQEYKIEVERRERETYLELHKKYGTS